MDVFADTAAGIRLRPADLPLVLREHLDLLDGRRTTGASAAEFAVLVSELRQVQGR